VALPCTEMLELLDSVLYSRDHEFRHFLCKRWCCCRYCPQSFLLRFVARSRVLVVYMALVYFPALCTVNIDIKENVRVVAVLCVFYIMLPTFSFRCLQRKTLLYQRRCSSHLMTLKELSIVSCRVTHAAALASVHQKP